MAPPEGSTHTQVTVGDIWLPHKEDWLLPGALEHSHYGTQNRPGHNFIFMAFFKCPNAQTQLQKSPGFSHQAYAVILE